MVSREIERGSLAVTKDSRLVLAHGYSWASADSKPTFPTNLFRIASISKPITAVAILQLVERRKLRLDQAIGTVLKLDDAIDLRMRTVTIRQLLEHRGGWDRDVSFDPMFHDFEIAKALGVPLPTTPQLVIDFMKKQRLDFDPGARYAYSNFGYCLLGRIIEVISGRKYDEFVQRNVLRPLQISDMRIGSPLLSERAPGEVDYVVASHDMFSSVMGSESEPKVPLQYGGWNLTTMDAHGGWLASASDLVRFTSAFNARNKSPMLRASSIESMWARPAGLSSTSQVYYALGWQVRRMDPSDGINTWHTGSLDGTSTLLVRRHDGLNWALLFNQREERPGKSDYIRTIDPALHVAADQVTSWPTHDLFPSVLVSPRPELAGSAAPQGSKTAR